MAGGRAGALLRAPGGFLTEILTHSILGVHLYHCTVYIAIYMSVV